MRVRETHHDEVDERHGVERDVPEIHHPEHVHQDHHDRHLQRCDARRYYGNRPYGDVIPWEQAPSSYDVKPW